jgi:hypothetical protein
MPEARKSTAHGRYWEIYKSILRHDKLPCRALPRRNSSLYAKAISQLPKVCCVTMARVIERLLGGGLASLGRAGIRLLDA